MDTHLQMLIHDHLPVLLQHAQDFRALVQVPWARVDFHVDGAADGFGPGGDGAVGEGDAGGSHVWALDGWN